MAVCTHHGGRAPNVRQKAKERLAALVDPAIDELAKLIHDRYSHIRLAAAKDVLDRNGLNAKQEVEHSGNVMFTLRIDRGDSEPDYST